MVGLFMITCTGWQPLEHLNREWEFQGRRSWSKNVSAGNQKHDFFSVAISKCILVCNFMLCILCLNSVMCLAGVCAETTPRGWVSSKDGRAIWMCALYSQSCQGVLRPTLFSVLTCALVTSQWQLWNNIFNFLVLLWKWSALAVWVFTLPLHHSPSVSFCILASNAWVSLMNERERKYCAKGPK